MIPTPAPVYVFFSRCLGLPHSWFHLTFLSWSIILYFATFGSSAKCRQKLVTCDVDYACINGFNPGIFENTKGNHLVYDLRSKHTCVNSSMIFSDSAFPEGLPHDERSIVKFSSFIAKTFSLKQEEDRQCSMKPSIPTDDWPDRFTHDNHNMFNYRNDDVWPYYAEKNLNTKLKSNFPGFYTDIYFHVPYGCNHNMSYDSKSLSTDMWFIPIEFSLVIDDAADDFSVPLHRLFGNLSVFHSFVSQPLCEIHHVTGTLRDDVILNKIPYFNFGGCRVVDYYNRCRFSERHLKQWLGVNCDSVMINDGPQNSERITRLKLNCGSSVVFLDVEILCEKFETFKRLFKLPGRKLLLGQRLNFMSFFIEPLVYLLVKDFELVKSWMLSHPSYVEGVMHGKIRLDDSISIGKWHAIRHIQFSSKKLKGAELLQVAMKIGTSEGEEEPPILTRVSPTSSFQKEDMGGYVNQFSNKNNLPVFSIQELVLGPEELNPSVFCKKFPEMVVLIPLKFSNPVPLCSREGRPLDWVRSKRPFVAAFLLFSLLFLVFCVFSSQATASSLCYKSLPFDKKGSEIGQTPSELDIPSSWSLESPPFEKQGRKTGLSITVSPSNPVKVSDPLSQPVGSTTRAVKEKKRQRRKRKGGGGGSLISETSGSRSGNSTPSSPSSPVSYDNFGRDVAALPPGQHNSATSSSAVTVTNTHDVFSISPPPWPSRSPLPPHDRAPGPKSYGSGVKKEEEMMYDIWGDHLSRIRLCNVMGGSVEGAEHSFFTYGPHVLVKSRCGSSE